MPGRGVAAQRRRREEARHRESPIATAVRNDARRMWVKSARERQRVRNKLKRSMLEERRRAEEHRMAARMDSEARWRRRMERSPFAVDQLAEHERVDEELRVKVKEEGRRERAIARRKEKVKTEIIIRALSEASDVEALREEKRAILQEEKRLRALLEAERAKLHRKADQQAAVRAERHRQRAKREFRRKRFATLAAERDFAVRTAEMERLGLLFDPSQQRAVPIDSEAGRVALEAALRAGQWLPGMPMPMGEGGSPPPHRPGEGGGEGDGDVDGDGDGDDDLAASGGSEDRYRGPRITEMEEVDEDDEEDYAMDEGEDGVEEEGEDYDEFDDDGAPGDEEEEEDGEGEYEDDDFEEGGKVEGEEEYEDEDFETDHAAVDSLALAGK